MRRIANLRVKPGQILEVCREGIFPRFLLLNPIPADAKLKAASLDPRGDFVLTLESEAFAPVGALDAIPELPSPFGKGGL
jgi:hypothetical protein